MVGMHGYMYMYCISLSVEMLPCYFEVEMGSGAGYIKVRQLTLHTLQTSEY